MRLLVIGAGGHAKVVIDAARAAGLDIAGVVARDPDPATVLGIPVTTSPAGIVADGFIVAIGDNAVRAKTFEALRESGLPAIAVVHPSARLAAGVAVGAGAFIAPGVVVNVDACIGENAILNTGCTVDHDCIVGAHAHVGPGANLCGACSVGEGALVGVGASAVPSSRIGEWAVVGAGAAIVGPVAARAVVGGVPARPLASGGR